MFTKATELHTYIDNANKLSKMTVNVHFHRFIELMFINPHTYPYNLASKISIASLDCLWLKRSFT